MGLGDSLNLKQRGGNKGRRDVGQGHSLNLSKPGHKATRELRLSLTITLKKPDPTGTKDVGLDHLTEETWV